MRCSPNAHVVSATRTAVRPPPRGLRAPAPAEQERSRPLRESPPTRSPREQLCTAHRTSMPLAGCLRNLSRPLALRGEAPNSRGTRLAAPDATPSLWVPGDCRQPTPPPSWGVRLALPED